MKPKMVIIPVLLFCFHMLFYSADFKDGKSVYFEGKPYGKMVTVGLQVWLDRGTVLPAGIGSIEYTGPEGWRLPDKQELEQLIEYARSQGDVETFLKNELKLKDSEKIIMSSTKVHPEEHNGSTWEAWMFWGYNRATGSIESIVTFAISAEWAPNKKTDMSGRFIADIDPIAVSDINIKNGAVRKFKSGLPNVTSYRWDFGDGTFSSNKNPHHTYDSRGLYTVTLKVKSGNLTKTFSKKVWIKPPYNAGQNSQFYDGKEVLLDGKVVGRMVVSGLQVWLDTTGFPVDANLNHSSPPGWRLPGKDELELMVEYMKSQGGVELFLTDYLKLKESEQVLMSSTRVSAADYKGDPSHAGWMYWGYSRKTGRIEQIMSYFQGNMSARLILDIEPIQKPYTLNEGLTVDFYSALPNVTSYQWDFGDGTKSGEKNPRHTFKGEDIYTVSLKVKAENYSRAFSKQFWIRTQAGSDRNVTSINMDKIISIKTGVTIIYPPSNPYGYIKLPTAPLCSDNRGGFYILAARENGSLSLMGLDADNRFSIVKNNLGEGVPGDIAVHEDKIAYLMKIGENRADLRFIDGKGKNTIIMDNDWDENNPLKINHSGRGLVFRDAGGTMPFGTEAMFQPFTFGRVELHYGGNQWISAFPHGNNFTASNKNVGEFNGANYNGHSGEIIIAFRGEDAADPKLLSGWRVSHSMDMRSFSNSKYFIQLSIGDYYPVDLSLAVWDLTDHNLISSANLFGKHKYPDAFMGYYKDGTKAYGVAGSPGGVSIRMGDIVEVDEDLYAFTYALKPGEFGHAESSVGYWKNTIDELGVLLFNKQSTIVKRVKLGKGADVEFLHSVRYGKNILIAWKKREVPEYRMMVIDKEGTILQKPVLLPEGIFFNASDGFEIATNGDICWTAAGDGSSVKRGELVIFKMPLPINPTKTDFFGDVRPRSSKKKMRKQKR